MLKTAEMKKTLRRILDLSLFDKQRREDTREKCEIQKIDFWIKCRREILKIERWCSFTDEIKNIKNVFFFYSIYFGFNL